MTHPEWCGEECYKCVKHCALDARIPCSPDCRNFDKDGEPQPTLCKDCDSYKLNYIKNKELYELDKEIVIDVIEAYDKYIQYNAENNPEFGCSWYPVSVSEYFNNEFKMMLNI